MPSPPLLVHCLDHLADAVERAGGDRRRIDSDTLRAEADAVAATAGVVRPGRPPLPSPGSPAPARPATMRRDGTQWVLTTPLGDARLPDSNGLGQLARLLTTPGVEVSAVELAGRAQHAGRRRTSARVSTPRRSARIDSACSSCRSRSTTRRRVNDLVRSERAHAEMDALLRELRRAVGLGGRDRPTGSDAERARINVARSLRRAHRRRHRPVAAARGAPRRCRSAPAASCIYLAGACDRGCRGRWTRTTPERGGTNRSIPVNACRACGPDGDGER